MKDRQRSAGPQALSLGHSLTRAGGETPLDHGPPPFPQAPARSQSAAADPAKADKGVPEASLSSVPQTDLPALCGFKRPDGVFETGDPFDFKVKRDGGDLKAHPETKLKTLKNTNEVPPLPRRK